MTKAIYTEIVSSVIFFHEKLAREKRTKYCFYSLVKFCSSKCHLFPFRILLKILKMTFSAFRKFFVFFKIVLPCFILSFQKWWLRTGQVKLIRTNINQGPQKKDNRAIVDSYSTLLTVFLTLWMIQASLFFTFSIALKLCKLIKMVIFFYKVNTVSSKHLKTSCDSWKIDRKITIKKT